MCGNTKLSNARSTQDNLTPVDGLLCAPAKSVTSTPPLVVTGIVDTAPEQNTQNPMSTSSTSSQVCKRFFMRTSYVTLFVSVRRVEKCVYLRWTRLQSFTSISISKEKPSQDFPQWNVEEEGLRGHGQNPINHLSSPAGSHSRHPHTVSRHDGCVKAVPTEWCRG